MQDFNDKIQKALLKASELSKSRFFDPLPSFVELEPAFRHHHLAVAIDRTTKDMSFIKKRQNPPEPSGYKVCGLFTKHIMDTLPYSLSSTPERSKKEREINAKYAFYTSVLYLSSESDKNEYPPVNLNNLKHRDRIETSLLFLLDQRPASGESLAISYEVLAKANAAT